MHETSDIPDEALSELLESMPHETASPGFTSAVLQRLDARPATLLAPRWRMLAAAAVLLLVAGGLGLREWRHHQTRQLATAELKALLLEKQQLEQELLELRRLTSEARPVVYLGGNERVDLVLDMARFHSQGGFRSNRPPASTRTVSTQRNPSVRLEPLEAIY